MNQFHTNNQELLRLLDEWTPKLLALPEYNSSVKFDINM